VQDVREKHEGCLHRLTDDTARSARLCELNVIEQAANVCSTTIVQDAWARGQELTVHAWIYGLRDGLLRDLKMSASSVEEAKASHTAAIAALG
jgi:carbonic anhydrase